MALTAPVNVPGFTVNDQRALDGLQWAVDAYNAKHAGEPGWVDVTPLDYMKARLLTWLHREADRYDPLTSEDPDVLAAEVLRLRALLP